MCQILLHTHLHYDQSRKLFKVQARILQENEEKVVVEDSFQPKSSPEVDGSGSDREPPDGSSSSGIERWVIKLEQSINILLTVSNITLYCDFDMISCRFSSTLPKAMIRIFMHFNLVMFSCFSI